MSPPRRGCARTRPLGVGAVIRCQCTFAVRSASHNRVRLLSRHAGQTRVNAPPPKGVGFVVRDSSPVSSKARPKVSHPRWADAPPGQRDHASAPLRSTSSQADHLTKVPGSIRQPALAARGSTVWNRLRGRTAELPRFLLGEWPRILKPSPEGGGLTLPACDNKACIECH